MWRGLHSFLLRFFGFYKVYVFIFSLMLTFNLMYLFMFKLPLQGAGVVLSAFTQGVATGLNLTALSGRSQLPALSSQLPARFTLKHSYCLSVHCSRVIGFFNMGISFC